LFPGSSKIERKFALELVELTPGARARVKGIGVTPYEVKHPSGAVPFALRLEFGGRVVTYTGDTEWTDALIAAARGADLLIAEAYFFEKPVKFHLSYADIRDRLEELAPKRLILTHPSADMLARSGEALHELAEDGKVIEL
jgi:ribonuclease BN (tRNA processing enzyme)